MIKLISVESARKATIRNNKTLSLNEAMIWLNSLIEGACDNGKSEVEIDIELWHVATFGQGYIFIDMLSDSGYRFSERNLVNIVDGIEHKEKRITISW